MEMSLRGWVKPGCVASCEKMWEDVTLPIGVKFSKAQWFLISLSPAILEIMTSPVKNQKIIQIFLCCQSSLQMFWRCCRASNHSISVQFNCASCFGNTGKGVSNHHNPMNEQHGETERERETTQRGVGAVGLGAGISFSLCTVHQAVLPCMISWKKYIFHL